MKRGLISWDKVHLPPSIFDARLEAIDRQMARFDVPAVAVYTDVWRSNDVRFISNYMPYWNRAFAVVPRGEKPILLCALSPRVYPWIKSVTIHEIIVASPNLPKQVAKLCTERGWSKIGVFDHDALPSDLFTQLAAEPINIVDIPRSALRPGTTSGEIAMHREAAKAARETLEDSIGQAAGLTDYRFAGLLERKFRRAGAEDLVVLVSNGLTAPLPAAGNVIDGRSSVVVALERNGHWVKLSRNVAGHTTALPPGDGVTMHREWLSGPYAWEGITERVTPQGIISLQVEIKVNGSRLYYGDTCLQGPGHLEVL
jgi:hypothetical protein